MQTNDPDVRAERRHRQLLWALAIIAIAYPAWMRAVDALWTGWERQTVQRAPARSPPRSAPTHDDAAELARAPQTRGPPTVRVVGASAGRRSWMVLVDLDGIRFVDAGRPICSGAEQRLQRDVSGMNLRVEGYRGTEPALSLGRLMCP